MLESSSNISFEQAYSGSGAMSTPGLSTAAVLILTRERRPDSLKAGHQTELRIACHCLVSSL